MSGRLRFADQLSEILARDFTPQFTGNGTRGQRQNTVAPHVAEVCDFDRLRLDERQRRTSGPRVTTAHLIPSASVSMTARNRCVWEPGLSVFGHTSLPPSTQLASSLISADGLRRSITTTTDAQVCRPASRIAILAARATNVGIPEADTVPRRVRGDFVSNSKVTAYVAVMSISIPGSKYPARCPEY